MSLPFAIREYRRGDLDPVVALWREMMEEHAARDPRFRFVPDADAEFARHARQVARSAEARVFVADVGGSVVGYVLAELQNRLPIYPVGRFGFISDLSVTTRFRRKGIGRGLADRAIMWCRAQGATSVELYAAECNPEASEFWNAVGFAPYLRMLRMELAVAPTERTRGRRFGDVR